MAAIRSLLPSVGGTTKVLQQTGAKTKNISKSAVAFPTARISTADVKDPDRLAKLLVDLQEDVAQTVFQVGRCLFLSSSIFIGLQVTSGVQLLLRHQLGHSYTGYWVLRTYPGAAAPIALRDGALPQGFTVSQAAAVIPNGTGTITVAVF